MSAIHFSKKYFAGNGRKNVDRIPTCDLCSADLLDGYCEMNLSLIEKRYRLCFSCARTELRIKRAIENDDLLGQGLLERDL